MTEMRGALSVEEKGLAGVVANSARQATSETRTRFGRSPQLSARINPEVLETVLFIFGGPATGGVAKPTPSG